MKSTKAILSVTTVSLLNFGLYGADWLSIAGSEPSIITVNGKKIINSDTQPHIWGFIQAGYQQDDGTILNKDGINKTPFVMLAPALNSQSNFELNRARFALRGMIDKENRFNYFFMTEFGNNGITNPAGHSANNYITDASITYKIQPYVNLRVGQFKYPGAEEGMRAVFATEYRNFTTATSQLLLERFIPNNATKVDTGVYQAAPTQSVNAFRDRGLELFTTTHLQKNVTLSLAGMIGNGTGLSSENSSGKPTYYGYVASEYLFGKGKGYFTQSLKGFLWYQNGKRQLQNHDYTRERYGFGLDYFHNGLRIDIEYIKAKGMIYNGAKDVDTDPYGYEWQYQIAASKKNEADGGYISAQYYIVAKRLELLARYDYLNRLTNSIVDEHDFTTTTLGFSYHFKKANRIDVNYAIRDITAPNNAAAQTVVDNIGNLLSIQATLKF